MSDLVPFNDMRAMADVAAKSRMFGFKSADEALAIMLLCQGEGMHPAVAMRDYHVIQGRPALKTDAMLARFQQAGGSVKWTKYTDDVVAGLFSHPQGGELEVTWTFAQAKAIGLTNKDNWRNYPRAMLRARCISEGIRTVYPGCIVGVYTPEEVQDMDAPREPKTVVAEVVPDAETYPVRLPGGSIYNRAASIEGWCVMFNEVADRVLRSEKLTVAEKGDKMRGLWTANEELIATLSETVVAELRKELADD